MNNSINIAFVTNDGYAPYLSTAIYSLIVNRDRRKQYALYVFYSSLCQKNIDRLSSLQTDHVTMYFVNLDTTRKNPIIACFYPNTSVKTLANSSISTWISS